MRREREPPPGTSVLVRIWAERSQQPPYREVRLRVEAAQGVQREFGSTQALARYLDAIVEALAQGGDVGDVGEVEEGGSAQ